MPSKINRYRNSKRQTLLTPPAEDPEYSSKRLCLRKICFALYPTKKSLKMEYPTTLNNMMVHQQAGCGTAGALNNELPGQPLPLSYEPGPLDVLTGRGKRNWNHAGNAAFRTLIQSQVQLYMEVETKNEKTAIVCKIVEDMRIQGARFLKQDKEKHWFDIGDKQARDKVGHGLRDQVTAINRQTKEQQGLALGQQPGHVRRPSVAYSDSGNNPTDVRKVALHDTTRQFEVFARRPSWIAGESNSSNEMEGIPAPSGFMMERRRSSWDFVDTLGDFYMDPQAIEPLPLYEPATEGSASNNSDVFVSMAPPTKRESVESSKRESINIKASIKTFDPRMSGATSVYNGSSSMRGDPMRLSGSSTLRRATNSLRMSNQSAMAMSGLLDFSDIKDLSESTRDFINHTESA